MIIFSDPLMNISMGTAEKLTPKGFQNDSRYARIWINLKENTYSSENEKINFLKRFSPDTEFAEIRFLKKILKTPASLSGFLDDSGVVKTALLIGTAKKSFPPPVRMLAVQLNDLLFRFDQTQTKRPATIHYRDVEAVMRWAEALRTGSVNPDPEISAFKWSRICQILYGRRLSGTQRALRMASAYRQVLSTDESLLSIALRTGYISRSYFITAFKKTFAVTPGVLRSHYRPSV